MIQDPVYAFTLARNVSTTVVGSDRTFPLVQLPLKTSSSF